MVERIKTPETIARASARKDENDERTQRIDMIGTFPESEVRLFFEAGGRLPDAPIVPEHLLSTPTREGLLVPAQAELERVLALLATNTTGAYLGDVVVPKPIQILIAALHNQGVEKYNAANPAQKAPLICDHPREDMIMHPKFIYDAVSRMIIQLQTLPADKRVTYTLLDWADNHLLAFTKGKTPRKKVNAHKRS